MSESLKATYESRIRAALEERKRYPTMAKSLGQTGRVVLRFVVERDGTVSRSELLQKSPYPLLNRATQGILEGVTKLEPIPRELHRLSWEFTVPVDYRLD
jgi:protein TonB